MSATRNWVLSALVAIAAITALAYFPGMSSGFYFDDEPNILRAPALHWTEVSAESLRRTLTESTMPSRPTANISFALTHWFTGLDPAPYHWTNLVIHLAVGLALFWVIRLFQQQHLGERSDIWLALLAVLLFLIHPLNIQAVTYVVQRMTSMSALFFLLGFGCYMVGRYRTWSAGRTWWLALTSACFLLSTSSKELGYLLPPFLLLYEFCFHRGSWRNWYRNNISTSLRLLLGIGSAVLLLLLALALWYRVSGSFGWFETMPTRDFSGYERVLTQGRVQFFYLSLLLWPAASRLNLDHEFVVSRGLFDPVTTAFALVGLLLILAFALRMLRSRPTVAFPLLAYLLLHSIESGPINLEMVFEHRMYLPMTMLALLMSQIPLTAPRKYRRFGYGTLFVLALTLAAATHARNEVWADKITLLQDTAQKSPSKRRPLYNLGSELGVRGMVVEAKTALEQALRIQPDDSKSHNQLANVYTMTKQPVAAERHYRLAIEYDPKNAEPLYNLSMLLRSQNRLEEQRQMLRQFIEKAPPYLEKQKQQAMQYLDPESLRHVEPNR